VSKKSTRIVGTVLALLVILALPKSAFACSCMWAGPFSKVAPSQELIVLGEVLSHYKNSMDVRVIEVLKGTEEGKTIRIWGDTGALCRPYVSHFPVGTTWLVAVRKTTAEQSPPFWERLLQPAHKSDYAISICGDFWLKVQDDRAVGRVTVKDYSNFQEWVPLKDMLAWLRSNGRSPILSPTPLSPSSH
jgi:hypothetical protein